MDHQSLPNLNLRCVRTTSRRGRAGAARRRDGERVKVTTSVNDVPAGEERRMNHSRSGERAAGSGGKFRDFASASRRVYGGTIDLFW